jgi:hypothetical protein
MRPLPLLLAASLATSAGAATLVVARGSWAAVDHGRSCQAVGRAERVVARGRVQPVAGWVFDAAGPRRGQFFVRLGRPVRPGASVILRIGSQPFLLAAAGQWAWSRGLGQEAAILLSARTAAAMRVEARDTTGRRLRERWLLDGAATAVDAAAAACAGKSRAG